MDFSSNGVLKLVVGNSKKKANCKYYALCVDLVYTCKYLTFNVSDIAEILGESVPSIIALDVGEYEIAL